MIILPDHLKRDFATKYKGYAKSATWAVPAFALATVGVVFGPKAAKAVANSDPGKWVKENPIKWIKDKPIAWLRENPIKWISNRGIVTSSKDFVATQWGDFTKWSGETVRGVTSKIPDHLLLKGRPPRRQTIDLYRKEADDFIAQYKKSIEDGKKNTELLTAAKNKAKAAERAEELLSLHRQKSLWGKQKLKNKEAVNARIQAFEKEIKNDFMIEYEKVRDIRGLTADRLSKRIEDTRRYYEMESAREVVKLLRANTDDVAARTKAIDTRIDSITNTLIPRAEETLKKSVTNSEFGYFGLKHADARTLGVPHRAVREGAEAVSSGARRGAIPIGAGTVAAYGVMVSFDKSIWGYSDRQVSKHWSQIFHDQDDFGADSTSVRDLPGILKSLADAYGFTVNSKAIALGN